MNEQLASQNGEESLPELEFRTTRSPGFKTMQPDGVWMSRSPSNRVSICFYMERFPTPESFTFKTTKEGNLGDLVPEKTVIKSGIEREIEMEVTLSTYTATALMQWLSENLPEIREGEKKARERANAQSQS